MQIGNTVLPNQPPRPNMMKFPTLDLASETLPAHNATLQSILLGGNARPNGNFMPNLPIIKANLPNMPNLSGRIQSANPISLELKAVTPSLRMNDLGGMTSSMSKFGGIGQSGGRSFGSESFMTQF